MIFQHTWAQVIDGTKTQTRRIVKAGAVKWADGKTCAVQPGRGKKAIGRIRITAIRREDVRTISDADVTAEGFTSRADFLRLWEQMHGAHYEAWVLEFKLAQEQGETSGAD